MPSKETTEAEEYLLQLLLDKKFPFQQEKFSVLH